MLLSSVNFSQPWRNHFEHNFTQNNMKQKHFWTYYWTFPTIYHTEKTELYLVWNPACVILHPFGTFYSIEIKTKWFMFVWLINQPFVLFILIIFCWYFKSIHFNGPKWILLFRLSKVLTRAEEQAKFNLFVPKKFQRPPAPVQSWCGDKWWSRRQSLVSICQNQISFGKQRSRWERE